MRSLFDKSGGYRLTSPSSCMMKRTDVARASLGELLGDFEIFLAERGGIPWSIHADDHQALSALNFPAFEYTDDVLHDYWAWFHREKLAFDPWLNNANPDVVANALIILIRRAMAMLGGQMRQQGEVFLKEGGFRERLTQCRVEARDPVPDDTAPACPACGKTMRQRTARKGPNAGKPFWSCLGYPECKGTRPVEHFDFQMAEREGFEPPVPFDTHDFESCALNRALPPLRLKNECSE